MTLKILALIILSFMGIALLNPSDAYQVGYAEGRFDLYHESKAVKFFNECVVEKLAENKEAPEAEIKKAAEACWQKQIEWTKPVYRAWDGMTDQQKVDHVKQSAQVKVGIKWADILRGNTESKLMPPLPVEIK